MLGIVRPENRLDRRCHRPGRVRGRARGVFESLMIGMAERRNMWIYRHYLIDSDGDTDADIDAKPAGHT